MSRRWLIGVLALAACESKPTPPPPVAHAAHAAPADAVEARPDAAAAAAPKLPGTLWFVDDGMLARVVNGERKDVATQLFPSRWHLPDGRLVAIASRGDGGPEAEQLALVASDGTVARFGAAAAQVRDPMVEPRGTSIVAAINADGHSDLVRLDVATGTATRLTNDPQGNFSPAPLGGDAIVFASSRDGDSEIYRVASAGGKPQRLTAFYKDDFAPLGAPDGKTIVFSSDREGPVRLFVMAPDGTRQHRLTERGAGDGDEVEPAWSPDGKWIAYVVEHGAERRLWLRALATGRERAVTPASSADAEPSFSPDGAWLAVSRTVDGKPAIWALPIDGGEPVRVASGRLPRWQ